MKIREFAKHLKNEPMTRDQIIASTGLTRADVNHNLSVLRCGWWADLVECDGVFSVTSIKKPKRGLPITINHRYAAGGMNVSTRAPAVKHG